MNLELVTGLVQGCADRYGNQIFRRHKLSDGLAEVGLKPGITIGYNAGQFAVRMNYGNA